MGNTDFKRVQKDEMNRLPKIVAIDFDGTLVKDMFPLIGEPNKQMFDFCKQLQMNGIKLILWTSRDGLNLDDAVAYCKEGFGLVFDAVNENIKETQELFNNDTRKVYADLYIDDKAIPHTMSPSSWADRLGLTYNLEFGTIHGA